MAQDLQNLKQLQKLKMLRSQKDLHTLQAEENRIRKDLATLNSHRFQSRAADPNLIPMRSIGADVLWQGWIDRTQADLTTDLAKLLVRKEPIARRVATDTGRYDVVAEKYKEETKKMQHEQEVKEIESMIRVATTTSAPKDP
jgi:hypothetical protein